MNESIAVDWQRVAAENYRRSEELEKRVSELESEVLELTKKFLRSQVEINDARADNERIRKRLVTQYETQHPTP